MTDKTGVGPLYWPSNFALFAALYPAHRTAVVRWAQPLDDLLPLADERPIIFCAFHRYAWVLLTIFGRHVPPALRPYIICHDGPISKGQSRAGKWLGYPLIEFRRDSAQSPRHQLIERLQRAPDPVSLLPDSGGPYGVVKPGIIKIATAVDAVIVPWAVRVERGRMIVGQEWKHVVPLPFSHLTVYRGATLSGAAVTRERVQRELDSLEGRVRVSECLPAHAVGA